MVQRCASSAMASCAWRLVPTKRIVLPWPARSLTNFPASRNNFRVFCRSMMWIPLRSPKMYSFIFGFQRRVWWPKCTPASSSSFIVISTANVPPRRNDAYAAAGSFSGNPATPASACRLLAGREFVPLRHHGCGTELIGLALAVLEALAGALLPVLLAFLHARIARQKTVLAQACAQLRVEPRQRPRQSHAHRAGLPAGPAAFCRGPHVHLVQRFGEFQRFHRRVSPGHVLEVLLHRAAVHFVLARAQLHEHARHRFLAAARAVEPLCSGFPFQRLCASAQLSSPPYPP